MIHIACPYCQQHIAVAENWSGIMVCTNCQRQVAVRPQNPEPAPGAAAPAPPAPGVSAPITTSARPATTPRRKKSSSSEAGIILAVLGVAVLGGAILIGVLIAQRPEPAREPRVTREHVPFVPDISKEPPSTRVVRRAGSNGNGSNSPGDRQVVRRRVKSDGVAAGRPRSGTLSGDAKQVLTGALNSWKGGGSYQDYLSEYDYVASLKMPEWQDDAYSLRSHRIRLDSSYQQRGEYLFQVTLFFEDQGVAERHPWYLVTQQPDGRWKAFPVEVEEATKRRAAAPAEPKKDPPAEPPPEDSAQPQQEQSEGKPTKEVQPPEQQPAEAPPE